MLASALAALVLPLALLAQAPSPQPPKSPATAPAVDPARLEIAPKGRRHVGSIGPREKQQLVYTFTNISTAPIALRVGDLSPGVTVQGPALDKPIGPKASVTLTMTIDPTDFVGVQRRNVRLLTDDPKQGQYLLPVEMRVRPDLTVDLERKSFGEVAPHESPVRAFVFKRETDDPLMVRLTSPLPDYLEQETETNPATRTTELRFTLRPHKIAPGVQLGLETLQVETNAPKQPTFTLYLDWKLRKPVEATPPRLVFLDAAARELKLELRSSTGKPFVIQTAQIEGDGFGLAPLPTESALTHKLSITRQTEAEAKALLVLHFVGQEEALQVPLAYLPAVPAK